MILHKGLREGGIRQKGKTETFLRRTAGRSSHGYLALDFCPVLVRNVRGYRRKRKFLS